MRSLLIPLASVEVGGQLPITGDDAHHLLNVVRVQKDEPILVFDGNGNIFRTKISSIKKGELNLLCESKESAAKKFNWDLAFGVTKREAFSKVIANATEIGMSRIIPLVTEFSQKCELDDDRVFRVLKSAVEQSNNPFLPIYTSQVKIESINFSSYDHVYLMTTSATPSDTKLLPVRDKKILILIGPEGGFSERETKSILEKKNVTLLHIPMPILRTEHAVIASTAYLLSVSK